MSVSEIEAAIARLSPDEVAELANWFAKHQAEVWDEQLEQDVRSGKLDHLAREAEEDHKSGKCTPL